MTLEDLFMKILIADDDKEIVELLSIYVHNEGYEAVKAYDGKEALSKIRTIPDIELLILDIMMPEMDGMQVVKELRKESQIAFVKEGELLITELITTRIETFNRSKRIIVMIPSANNSLISFEVKLIRRRFSVARLLSCVNFIAHSPNGLNDFFTTSCFFNLIS